MTQPSRQLPSKQHRRPQGYLPPGGRRHGSWKRHETTWLWNATLRRGVMYAWLILWRCIWWLHICLVFLATLLLLGHWVGSVRLPSETVIEPLRAGVLLYWVLAASLWIVFVTARRQRAHDPSMRLRVREQLYPNVYAPGSDPSNYGFIAGDFDMDYGDSDMDYGDFGGGGDGGD